VSEQSDGELTGGERAVLIACAQHPNGLQRKQLTVLTGYKRSSRDTYIQRLRQRQYVDVSPGGAVIATDVGVSALGNFEPLPTGQALQDYWLGRLSEGEKKILSLLINAYPQSVARDQMEEAGYQRSSRDTYIQRLRSKELVEIIGRGEVKASDNLFDG
jgi:DNA-binding MarR family transcriptional regulator